MKNEILNCYEKGDRLVWKNANGDIVIVARRDGTIEYADAEENAAEIVADTIYELARA